MNVVAPRSLVAATTLAALLATTGCADMSERQKGTAAGAGIGAVAGAVIGKATGGNAGSSAVIGGAVGAVAGNLWSKRMQEKQAQMEKATQGTGVEVARTPDNQLKLNVPSDVSFDTGRSDIKPQMRPVLDQLAQGVAPDMHMKVIGHTDSTGPDSVNDPLSRERADSVAHYLENHGVSSTRIETAGRGEHEPVADNDTDAGRARNRRVEIFLSEPQAPAH